MTFVYDKEFDTLYLSLDENRCDQVEAAEIQEGIIIRKDSSKNEVLGVTVLGFMKRLEKDAIKITL